MRPKKAQEIVEILESPHEIQKRYLASWLIVCTLPHRDPKTSSYTRINGDCSLSIQTGLTRQGQEIGLPFGSLGRLLLFWLISEAHRTQSRILYLGDTIDGFVRAVGLDPKTGNGKRGDAKRLREQMHRLFACHISFTRTHVNSRGKEGYSWSNMEVAPKGELWWDPKKVNEEHLADSWIELGESLYEAATTNPVPMDFRAICALKQSPMAIDLYLWLTWRIHSLRDGKSVAIPLHGPHGLAQQLGSEYSQPFHFKAALAAGLKAVQQVWPQLSYELSASHLTLYKGVVPVAAVPVMKRRRALGEVQPGDLSVETLVWFQKTHPRIAFVKVWRAYRAFLRREKITPHAIDAHFQDYAEKWVKGEF
jgi:hypothetical protein